MNRTLIGASAALLMFTLPAAADEIGPVDVTNQYVQNYAREGSTYSASGTFYGPGDFTNTSASGLANSNTTFSQIGDSQGAQFNWTFTNTLGEGSTGATYYHRYGSSYYYAYAQSVGYLQFTVTADTSYDFDLSGMYEGTSDGSHQFYAYTRLVGPNGQNLYEYEYANSSEVNLEVDGVVGTGTVGQAYGDTSGTLVAGTYWVHFSRYVMDVNRNGLAAEGAGNLTLTIGEVNAVPEPGTYALLGLAGLALFYRRRK